MRTNKLVLFVSVVLAVLCSPRIYGQANNVVIDGTFTDWDDEYLVVDPLDDATPDKTDFTRMGFASNYNTTQPANTLYFHFRLDPTSLPGGAAVVVSLDTNLNGSYDYELRINVDSPPAAPGVQLIRLSDSATVSWSGTAASGTLAGLAGDGDSDSAVEISLPLANLGLSAGAVILGNINSRQSFGGVGNPNDMSPDDPNQRFSINTATGENRLSGPTGDVL